jgi:prolipoprotein diacylglyceryl transferase
VVPVLFHAGSFPVRTHEFFALLGVMVAMAVFLVDAGRHRRLDVRLVWIMAGALLGGGIGARLATVGEYLTSAADPGVAGALAQGGKSILGGLPGAYAGAVIAKRVVGYRRSTGDLFAPAVALGLAIGRVGCFFTEHIGTPTSLPWGIHVSSDAAARIPHCSWCVTGTAMHPSMLYEIVFLLVMFGLILWARPRLAVEGDSFKLFLLGYGLFRFWVEFVRGGEEVLAGLTRAQLFLIPTTLVMVAWFGPRLAVAPRRRLTAAALEAPHGGR